MTEPLWSPTKERTENSQIVQFQKHIEKKYCTSFASYSDFHKWTTQNIASFWEEIWYYNDIIASTTFTEVVDDDAKLLGAAWFKDTKLNFAENLLRYRDKKTALISLLENGERKSLTYEQLFLHVEKLAAALNSAGVEPGDRVVGFMPNIIETVVAMLATASVGAIWSSCSPDFGLNGAMDRFGQIQPKVLFAADGYYYNGKTIDCIERTKEISNKLSCLSKVVIVPVIDKEPDISCIKNSAHYHQFVAKPSTSPLMFEQLPFDHPLYIMYSSGTTGAPKCIVHGAGGTLLQHLKELRLHTDIKRDDTLFYFTTCGWMMWNWLVSGLACGSTLVLYDGSPFAEKGHILLNAIDKENISVFGTSAKYIASLEKADIKPAESYSLKSLRTLLTTGSPLSHESFDYIYTHIKNDLCLSSICGGTDIISCFMLGNPSLPVYRGELQCIGLGMAIEFLDDQGNSLKEKKGELVCRKAFPSCPVFFWNDPDNTRFRDAYFSKYDGIWAHGDYGETTAHGGVIIHGRSDAVLNPGGVRIGTAEIYRQVEKIDEVLESIVVGQEWQSDIRVVLFVVLREATKLDNALKLKICQTIRANTTPRHVPEKIIQVDDIPRTISGKIVELAVNKVIHNRPVKNTDALANPEALEQFRNLKELGD